MKDKRSQIIEINIYSSHYQNKIDLKMQEITEEFITTISNQSSAATSKLIDKYWLAVNEEEAVMGTIGVDKIKNNSVVLKRMFVQKSFRGKERGLAELLLQKALTWCKKENMDTIYLRTMNKFKAAHKFYEKNGFWQIDKTSLPIDFINNPVDDVFYKKNI